MSKRSTWLFAALGGLVPCGPVAADAYLLTPGDVLEMSLSAADLVAKATIDIDGDVRVRGVGGIAVSGLTLDAAEKAIEDAITALGLYVAPDVSLSVQTYAPVLVTGDVATPGRFEYLPQLTAETVLGLSGGATEVRGTDRLEVERARVEVDGQILVYRADILSLVTRIARLEAELDETQDSVLLSDSLRRLIPVVDEATLAEMLADQQAILANTRQQESELLQSWADEIADLERQREVLGQRMELQDHIAESLQSELQNVQMLSERGLTTSALLTRAEQLANEAQLRTFELETVLTNIERGISDARRQRTNFVGNTREEKLVALFEARVELSELRLRYGTAETQKSVLADGNVSTLLESGLFEIVYTLTDGRTGEVRTDVPPSTRLRPGDTLLVRVDRNTGDESLQ